MLGMRCFLGVTFVLGLLAACGDSGTPAQRQSVDEPAVDTSATGAGHDAGATGAEHETASESASLAEVVASRSDEERSRDGARHPAETLAFFGVKPGMKVAEALPGGGWYSKIIARYVGHDGAIYGVNYQDNVWEQFGWSADRVAASIARTGTFADSAPEWAGFAIPAQGFTFANVPDEVRGQVDALLFIRALHNLHRFKDSGVLDEALTAAFAMVKPGGVVGVVQHRAPEAASDEWAGGNNGYLKVTNVVSLLENVGFVFEEASEINGNPKDQPSEDDFVWRLPPSYATSKDDATKAAMSAIGESDRMTLRFRKPF